MDVTEHQKALKKTLRLRHGSADTLSNREGSRLEFKETFNLGSRERYAKTMAAFANNAGGYIVFGVKNSPHLIKGLQSGNFANVDPAKITQFLNEYFSPEIEWEIDTCTINGMECGYIYTAECEEKPVVCTKGSSSHLKEGDIYYRYRGQSTVIKYPELRGILDGRLERERRAWMQHFEAISSVGPTNVGILDTVHGKLFGAGAPFLIDESLLRDIKFIKEGKFNESTGEPTLKLVGEVQPIHGVGTETAVHVGIHIGDLFTAFLAQRRLNESEASSYLKETAYQNTWFVPLHYFFRTSGLELADAIQMIEGTTPLSSAVQKNLKKRLTQQAMVDPVGAVDVTNIGQFGTKEELLEGLSKAKSGREIRSTLLVQLRRAPEVVLESIGEIPVGRLSEAATHLTKEEIEAKSGKTLEIFLKIFVGHFGTLPDSERSIFRKAVSCLDERLFAA